MIARESPDPEPMKYAILGHDTRSTAEKLESYTGTVVWSYLRPHFQNGLLYFVDPALALAEVGAAVAENDAAKVAAWLKSGDLVIIGDLHAVQWEGGAGEFEALVVSPFVLFRPVVA